MFTRMDHVAVSVQDMDRVIAFYRDVIGMEKVFDREFDAAMGRIIGVEGTQVRVVHMRLKDSVVELFHYRYPQGREPEPGRIQADFGLIHIGFFVENFFGTYQTLVSKGVRFLGEPTEIRPGVHVAYFHGAEYEICEMREILPQQPSA